ncbi:MAG: dihydroorotase [Alloprevotella sp.]|nr:dihydroorotase [Prevotellamassilia sp.]MCI6143885.1 dihydroorotase [Bacteroidales bacterium]MDY2778600.1 dihydroorotase [Alloprevotella sp.]MDY4058347.1 dihydroorotase [Alloprevotella sp.]MDY4567821.1 dihydroorotase [Alloprevotella sp.]
MLKRTLIYNVTMVNEGRRFKGGLLIEDDRIERIFDDESLFSSMPAGTGINAEGCYLLPGVIDDHVHFREPGLTAKADIESESRAAAAGGVTTYIDMPNTLPQTTTVEALKQKRVLAAHKSHVNYGFFVGATRNNIDELRSLNRRKVCGIKLFMGASTGNMLVDDEEALDRLFEQARLPIMTHCEDGAMIAENMAACKAQYGDDPDVALHSRIRSAEACYASTAEAVRLAKKWGARLHVAHISTAKELELFTPGDSRITAEVCLPHLLFTEADYARLGSRIKCNPAVKTAEDRDALRKALTDGRISVIGTDHAPHTITDKQGGAARAASGMPTLQFSLVSMLQLVDEGVLSLERMVELMCHAPARLFNIEGRGYLREGYKADLVLVRPHSPWTLTPNKIESRCNWSPLEGRRFNWKVEKTFCNGYLIYNNGQITDETFHGQPVTFDR